MATGRRLQAERNAAAKIVEDALRRAARDGWQTIANDPELMNIGVLECLSATVTAEMTRNPKHAAAVANLALSLAESLPPDSYPAITLAQTRAIAWKDRGKILSYLARHDEALRDFAEALRLLKDFDTLEHDRAIIRINVAITYSETQRYQEALATFAGCKEVFRGHEDTERVVIAGLYEGHVHERLHKYREARETYLLLIASAHDISTSLLAALHHNIGVCSTELGDYDAAEDNLRTAVFLHLTLRQTLDAVKGEHALGRLLVRRGFHAQALALLRPTRHQYLRHSLAEEAGLCGLEMVEAFLSLRKFGKAERLARTIMNEFLAASLNARALTALGYLTEAIAEKKAVPNTAVAVREYVLSLRTNPEREFQPEELLTDAGPRADHRDREPLT